VRKGLLVLAGLALAAEVIVPAALLHHAYSQRLTRGRFITWERYRGVKLGMTQAEVEAVLVGPPGNFTTGKVAYGGMMGLGQKGERQEDDRVEWWAGDQGEVLVFFTDRGVVRGVWWYEQFAPRASLADRLRAWLRRLWP
jgi:hypothetical protein